MAGRALDPSHPTPNPVLFLLCFPRQRGPQQPRLSATWKVSVGCGDTTRASSDCPHRAESWVHPKQAELSGQTRKVFQFQNQIQEVGHCTLPLNSEPRPKGPHAHKRAAMGQGLTSCLHPPNFSLSLFMFTFSYFLFLVDNVYYTNPNMVFSEICLLLSPSPLPGLSA